MVDARALGSVVAAALCAAATVAFYYVDRAKRGMQGKQSLLFRGSAAAAFTTAGVRFALDAPSLLSEPRFVLLAAAAFQLTALAMVYAARKSIRWYEQASGEGHAFLFVPSALTSKRLLRVLAALALLATPLLALEVAGVACCDWVRVWQFTVAALAGAAYLALALVFWRFWLAVREGEQTLDTTRVRRTHDNASLLAKIVCMGAVSLAELALLAASTERAAALRDRALRFDEPRWAALAWATFGALGANLLALFWCSDFVD
jgi:hypothetical protein